MKLAVNGMPAHAQSHAPAESLPGVTRPTRRGRSDRRIGDVIEELGFAEREVIEAAVEIARRSGEVTGQVMLKHGILTPDQLARAVAERYSLDHLDLSLLKPDMGAANLIDSAVARKHNAVPVAFVDEQTLLVAMTDPANILALDDVAMMTGLNVRRAVASPDDIAGVIAQLDHLERTVLELEEPDAGEEPAPAAEATELRGSAQDAPVVKLVHSVIGEAIERGASDVHFDPTGHEMQVRLRIDGVMWDTTTIPRRLVAPAVSRIKIMADIDISERRMPQDGRMSLTVNGRSVDLRVVTLPTVEGESIVVRILDRDERVMGLDELGMLPYERERLGAGLSRTHGAVLVTGPTGSGKSTTLHAALAATRMPEQTAITIEDPVECRMDGIKQVQVNPKIGLTFARGLRSMLRADPDIILVGEIRDSETAQIAIEASLTGHLILSTLHTNDAPTAVTRLIDMEIEPFLVASSVSCVVAQRLARALCPACKRRVVLTRDVLADSGLDEPSDVEGFEAVGCVRCGGTGYRGRVGLFEVMLVDDELRELVLHRRPADAIAALAVSRGMRRLKHDGIEKVKLGQTSLAEVMRVTGTA